MLFFQPMYETKPPRRPRGKKFFAEMFSRKVSRRVGGAGLFTLSPQCLTVLGIFYC